mgnify:CR=1 FL=1
MNKYKINKLTDKEDLKINVIDYSERYVNDLKKDNVVTDNKNAFILTSPLRASENEDGSWWNIIRNIVTQKNLEDTEKIKKTNSKIKILFK